MADNNKQIKFEKNLITEYFICGSIDKVFQKHHHSIPISFASYARLLSKFGVIKSAGPNSKISESLYILTLLANYKIPLEKIYHRFAPHLLQVSTNTLHRILHYTRLGLTRRQGTALIITTPKLKNRILIGNDISLSNTSLGRKGDLSLPMGHSKVGESIKDSITRVLQNEVFTDMVVNQQFPYSIIPEHNKPIMFINITDIKVAVYHIEIPSRLNHFSSFKLSNLKFIDYEAIQNTKNVRAGVKEIISNYIKLKGNHNEEVLVLDSDLNNNLYALAQEPTE